MPSEFLRNLMKFFNKKRNYILMHYIPKLLEIIDILLIHNCLRLLYLHHNFPNLRELPRVPPDCANLLLFLIPWSGLHQEIHQHLTMYWAVQSRPSENSLVRSLVTSSQRSGWRLGKARGPRHLKQKRSM